MPLNTSINCSREVKSAQLQSEFAQGGSEAETATVVAGDGDGVAAGADARVGVDVGVRRLLPNEVDAGDDEVYVTLDEEELACDEAGSSSPGHQMRAQTMMMAAAHPHPAYDFLGG